MKNKDSFHFNPLLLSAHLMKSVLVLLRKFFLPGKPGELKQVFACDLTPGPSPKERRVAHFIIRGCVVWFAFVSPVHAQVPSYEMYVTNEVLTDPHHYQFDIFILRTGNTPLELATVQFGLGFDVSIVNGGTLSASIVGNSELLPAQVPVTVSIGTYSQTQVIAGKTYRFFNCAARTPGGAGSGTLISNVNANCSHPGTRVGTFRLSNTAAFAANSHCNHIFSTSPASGRTNTLVNAYVGTVNTTVTDAANHLGYNSVITCAQNIALNSGGCVPPLVSETHINATCSSANGSINISAGGGTGPYTYLWNNGSTAEDRSKVKPGTYTVTVTNSGGCTASLPVTIQGIAMEAKIYTDHKISCFASCDGILRAKAITGVGPFTYAWSNGTAGSTVSNLCKGTYTVIVTDSKGCTGTVSKVLNQPTAIIPTCVKTEITYKGAGDGTITWQTHGGKAPYTYLWSDGYTTGNRTGIAPGNYTITITDAAGCNKVVIKKWKNPAARIGDVSAVSVSVYPNPSTGLISISFDESITANFVVKVLDINNKVIVEKKYEPGENDQQITMDLSALPKGVYLLDIKGDEINDQQKLVLQ